MNYDNKVARGASVLDSVEPNWVNEIDLQRLDVSDAENCPCGQTFGRFMSGLYAMERNGIDVSDTAQYGFTIDDGIADIFKPVEWGKLTEAWARFIVNRRLEDSWNADDFGTAEVRELAIA